MTLLPVLEEFFSSTAPLRRQDRLLVAFSGGPDSTALLLGLSQLRKARGFQLLAAHLDHGLDRDSLRRAHDARKLSEQLEIPIHSAHIPVPSLRRPGESLEAAARRLRYGFLDEMRRDLEARYVATAHHRGDQVETVFLRLLFGTGIEGLAGIHSVWGHVVRPLLAVDRKVLEVVVDAAGLTPVLDPSNRALKLPRSRLRYLVLPHLVADDPSLPQRALGLSHRASKVRDRLDDVLAERLRARTAPTGASLDAARLLRLPPELWRFALSLLQRRAGAGYPAPASAQEELRRQLESGDRVGCDCGNGWCWETREDQLILRRRQRDLPPFAYTLKVPGEVEIPELGLVVRIRKGPVEGWMFAGSPIRSGLSLPLSRGERVTIRNRRPGDRIRPLGCAYERRLKDVLIDRRIPREERDRIPLLCLQDRIVWIPGITIADDCRIADDRQVWVAELAGNEPTEN